MSSLQTKSFTHKQKKIGGEYNSTILVDQLLSDATSEVGKAQLIMDNLINASEAGQRCNELVAALHGKAEQQES